MSLLLTGLSRLRLGKPALIRSSLILSNSFSTSLLQTPPCSIVGGSHCGGDLGRLVISYANEFTSTSLEKKVPLELVNDGVNNEMVTIGASHGWIATFNREDEVLRLQDDLNPVASDTDPKRIPLPYLVTLPHCQTQIITNVSMSRSSPEDKDCIVAVKFFGPQLSFLKPPLSQSNSKWHNIKIENPCFSSSRVMYSKKDDMFRIPGSGGQLIASWDLRKHKRKPMLQKLRYQNLSELTETKREILVSCCTSEHLVESESTGETFLVKWYQKSAEIVDGIAKMETKDVLLFKLDEEGNAVYTKDIGDLCIFISKSEPFCVPASSFPGMHSNTVFIWDVDGITLVDLGGFNPIFSRIGKLSAPFHIPPQNIN
ncbi:PREDICTED: uncharacterized protein LOC104763452 [Camelina sativa]|uniref:Uncharacterized protein LOC104763451 n=1 Tax=Camelina sativa TaxID=90675 RepID=A0ABM0XFB3_CAMSA|nr:PREDICTED: uncharacterized protein LOC104763451 [Camelina sativa]XP_010485123.1 PREDICTED: uncharacterized protein LOC104763452 [Camelina sativa]